MHRIAPYQSAVNQMVSEGRRQAAAVWCRGHNIRRWSDTVSLLTACRMRTSEVRYYLFDGQIIAALKNKP